ncbi:glycosyltransferase family 39 protein [Streptomyces sp. NPDC006552]|uniref:glycosyltransferase family 39 protein n=1 Tax=Streptomyces sp. NPDC006552 TaxID=3157179 RepID=UPI0033AAE6B0
MTTATESHPHAPVPPPPAAPPTAHRAPRWSLPALLAVLALAAALYAWNLSSSGLNSFYSAAVYSGTQSWKAWFFGSIDAGNFLTVDKPPFALMVMGLSCRILGFGTWQMMLPQVGAALGTIWILHASVKRVWGHAAAALTALVLALTPITVAINRDNNPDTLLVLLMVGGAALALRATRNGTLPALLAAAVCFGLAFDTKMLQGYIALPAVFAVYLYACPLGWLRKVRDLALAAVVLAVSSLWWAAAVSLTPANERPYIGGSTDGSAWDLILGYNGLGRVLGGEGNGGGGGTGGGGFSGAAGPGRLFNDTLGGQISWLIPFAAIAVAGGLVLRGRAPRTDPVRAALVLWGGWLVLHYGTFATAEGTMHPYYTTAVAPGVAALCGGGGVMLLRAFRTDRRWAWVLPVALGATGVWAVVLLRRAAGWNGWLWPVVALVMAAAIAGLLVFRTASGPRLRFFAAALAAAVVASVAGPAAYAGATAFSSGGAGGGMGGSNPTAGPATGGGLGGPGGGRPGGGGFPGGGQQEQGADQGGMPGRRGGSGGFPGGGEGGATPPDGESGGGFAGGGEMPGGGGQGGPVGSQESGSEQGGAQEGGSRPGGFGRSGGGMRGGGMGGSVDSDLVAYLEKHQDGATWLLAVANSQSAAQLILSTKKPVISMYGFTGSDKGMTVAKLKKLVESGQLHYIQVGEGGMGGGRGGGDDASAAVTAWVKKHGTAVKESTYSKTASAGSDEESGASASSGSASVYRLDASDVN